MKIIIHRGTHQIGGSCLEVATASTRLILDVGLPLDDLAAPAAVPPQEHADEMVSEVFARSHEVAAVLISHAHADHTGLLHLVPPGVPTRECHVLRPDRAMRAADVLAWLERTIKTHGAPAFLRSDNGPEFIAKEVQHWLADNQIRTISIDPGSPWQNGFAESFHGRFRDACLNQEQLWTLTEARVVVADFRQHYNHPRPHGKLGYQSPVRFAAQNQCPSSFVEAGQNHPSTLHTKHASD